MQCYTELIAPTAVTHSLSLPFLGAKTNNLIIARTSLLQIFELKSIITEADSGSENAATLYNTSAEPEKTLLGGSVQRTEATSKLVLIAEYPLSGTVAALARVKTLGTLSGGEALLISFRDAKLSLLEWDPQIHTTTTTSIHYYEGEDVQESPLAPDISDCPSYLAVDPGSRCAALKFGQRHLAILPFRQLDDDLVEDDFDPELDDPSEMLENQDTKMTDGEEGQKTPYNASFVLSLTTIDSSLTHPVHMAFLHEYREPTFGILSSKKYTSSGLLQERKDVLTYAVFTLELEQKASTMLLSVTGIPYDIHRIVPLPLPVGGALLVGNNELIHVDQAGKSTAIAVNEFARQCSSFPMVDQSHLQIKLEHCVVEQLGVDSEDLLIVLSSGELAVLAFEIDGRSVSVLTLTKIPTDRGGSILVGEASCISNMGRGRMFLGSEYSDAALLGWTRKSSATLSRKRNLADMPTDDINSSDEDLDDDLEDDLYGSAPTTSKQTSSKNDITHGQISFRVHDTIPNLAPLRDITLGEPYSQSSFVGEGSDKTLELVASIGRGKSGGLAVIKHGVDPTESYRHQLKSAHGIWSIHARKTGPRDLAADISADADYDHYLLATEQEESKVYKLSKDAIQEVTEGEFENDAGTTIDVGILAEGTRIVQVFTGEIRCYDSDFNLAQALLIEDETTGEELNVLSASFADPYALLLCDDSSIRLLQTNKSGEVEEIERSEALRETKWISGCLYKGEMTDDKLQIFLLSAEGGLHIFNTQDLEKPIYVAEGLSFLPVVLTTEYAARRSAAKDTLKEILVADLGDSAYKSPYLLVRNANNDIAIYQPFHYRLDKASNEFTQGLRWQKLSQPRLASYSEDITQEDIEPPSAMHKQLVPLHNLGGYAAVAQLGNSPALILKETRSSPKLLGLRGSMLKSVTSWNDKGVERGLALLDGNGDLVICELPHGFKYGDTGWAVKQIKLGKEVDSITYHAEKKVYVIGMSETTIFKLPEDDHHRDWANEDIATLPTHVESNLHILHPANWNIVFSLSFDPNEQVMCVRTLQLETSEISSSIQPLVVVGTATTSGEDLATKGHVYIYRVLDVVPEPGRPETGVALRLITQEEVKGAVTGVSSIGREGFLMMAQGQKVLIRGLKEDQSLLPVAFMDVQCYVTVCKELPGTGLCLIGDAVKGLWFVGYREEPYKMILLGKSRTRMEIMTADLLPSGKQLHIIVLDAECNMHVMQFDPEHPKSLSGQRLLHKSTFHTGHFPSQSLLLPSTLSAAAVDPGADDDGNGLTANGSGQNQAQPTLHHVLLTSQTGSLALLTSLSEPSYRRLSALQTHLTNTIEHVAGLNPRAYRAVESEVAFGGRGVLDGGILLRWTELGSQRKREAGGKVGLKAEETWVLRSDLEVISGAGLGYL